MSGGDQRYFIDLDYPADFCFHPRQRVGGEPRLRISAGKAFVTLWSLPATYLPERRKDAPADASASPVQF
jgi:hypothetical protein